MDSFKELLIYKAFNRLSLVAVLCWIIFGVTLFGIFADMEVSESRFDFRCDAKSDTELIRGKCFEHYEKRYNQLGFPVYGFVIVNFSVITIVCLIYSQTVKSRVNELQDRNADAEGQVQRTGRGLFVAYCCQLVTRFVLGILFVVLQTQLFYPRDFPSDYKCNLSMPTLRGGNVTISSGTDITRTYQCHNQRAAKKTFWTEAVIVVNGLFAVIVLIEILCISWSRARKGQTFIKDSNFMAEHLNSVPCSRKQERQDNEESLELKLERIRQGKLSSLDLSDNKIADAGVMHLCAEALTHSDSKLSDLNLKGNCITDVGLMHLSNALSHSNCKLSNLNLYGNSITDTGVMHITQALTHSNCKLSNLDLSGNCITDVGVMHLSKALTHGNCKLSKLNLYGNSITDDGVMYLTNEAFTHINFKLSGLDLSGNCITDTGAMHLSKALTHRNCKLSNLDLAGNCITDTGAMNISKALTHRNCKLSNLNLYGNSITDAGVMHIAKALTHSNCTLSGLNLSGNCITDAGVMHLSKAFIHINCKLSNLNLSGNSITDAVVINLSKALMHSNCKLRYLNIHGNRITDAGEIKLTEALTHSNCELSELHWLLEIFNRFRCSCLMIFETFVQSDCKLSISASSLNLYDNK